MTVVGQDPWMEGLPVKGVAFLLDDSVRVTAGPHSGSRGKVVSLVETTPQVVYRVELGDGTETQLGQADLITATAEDPGVALAKLQRWYSAQCDGEWEHHLGVRVGTLDNPGWFVEINLRGTPLESAAFPEVRRVDADREWIHCKVADGEFQGAGGPHMLGAIIEIFVRWAHDANRARPLSGPTRRSEPMRIHVTRDSVAAGDDVDFPHERTFSFPEGTPIEQAIEQIAGSGYLASIHGGRATWSVVSGFPLAVVAQQWSEPRSVFWRPVELSELETRGEVIGLHFNYHAQVDPELVVEVLKELTLHAF